jgi:DNA-binding NarL/FixJ family response regulator
MMDILQLRILIADDHAIMRDGLISLINAQPDMRVVADARDGREALRLARETSPDVAIIDISMPELNGIEAARQLKREHRELKVLTLTAYDNPVYLHQLLQAGATGYVLKNLAAKELIAAIRVVASGGTYLDPMMAAEAETLAPAIKLRGDVKRGDLTEREREILLLIARGYTNKEIAAQLAISVKTVETHKGNIMMKLDLKNRADAVRFAVQQGWLLNT